MRKLAAPFATLLLTCAAALTFSAPAHAAPQAPEIAVATTCPDVCATVYEPVRCRFSDGSTGTFSNKCFATIHACNRGIQIVSCARI
ncbi:hypothetical protein [Streptomyces sp. NPDC046261]|uniref:hypothetical protein n=1 Tax=Streptomyces sp. NPDC046261 TaxID=3157200 RepID=UPI0033CE2927